MALGGTILGWLFVLWPGFFILFVAMGTPGRHVGQALHYYAAAQEEFKKKESTLTAPASYSTSFEELGRTHSRFAWHLFVSSSYDHLYELRVCQAIAGKPIDWKEDFALCATPLKYGGRSKRTFIVSTNGIVWHKDLGRSEFIADFPADPAAAGWHKLHVALPASEAGK